MIQKLKLLVIVILLIQSSTTFSQTTVTVKIVPENDYPLELLIYNIDADKYESKTKLKAISKGVFNFEVPSESNLYKLKLGSQELGFINDNDSHITIDIDLTNSQNPFDIKGSLSTHQYADYFETVARLQQKLFYPLEPRMKAALEKKDQKLIESVENEYANNQKLFVKELDEKISSMGSSLAVYSIIKTLDFNKYLDNISKWHKVFIRERPNSKFTTKLTSLIDNTKRLQIGSKAPEIELPLFGKDDFAKLSELKGELILIDFWASWCLPCIKENGEFKEKYAELQSKGLKIWSISIDEKEDRWIKALDKYDLPWMQSITNDKTVEKTYNVVTLPTNFLIDKKGNIKAKNIKAKDIESYLDN